MTDTTDIRHFLDISDVCADDMRLILSEALRRKAARAHLVGAGAPDADAPGCHRVAGLYFARPSTRTRISFDIALRQIGARGLQLPLSEMQIQRGESLEDTARVLSGYLDALVARVGDHAILTELAEHASIPIINALSIRSHPCQIVGDLMTISEHCGPLEAQTLAWLGDGNNVAASFIQAAAVFGFRLRMACPSVALPDEDILRSARAAGARIDMFDDPFEAASRANCVMTDTWASLHHEDEEVNRRRAAAFRPLQVTDAIMAVAHEGAIFLHCLPAYRDHEVVGSVIDGPQSRVFLQAVNRVHAQKVILMWCWRLL